MNRQGWKGWAICAALALAGCGERSNLEIMEAARAFLAQKDVAAAKIELRSLLQRKPNASEARFLLGKILYEAGDTAGAEDQLTQALQFGYPEEEVVPLLAQVLASLNRSKALLTKFGDLEFKDAQASAELKVQVATARIREGEIDKGAADVERALALAPSHPTALVLRARLKAMRGDEASAGRDVDQLLARMPDSAEGLALKGDLSMMAGQVDAALDLHRRALALRANLSQSHAAVLAMLIARGDLDGASAQWKALKAALPNHPQTHFFEATLALLNGEPDRARLIAHAMLQSSPTDVRLLLLAGQAELQLNQHEQAEALLSRAVSLAFQAAVPRHMLAEVYLRTGRANEALALLRPLLAPGSRDAIASTLAARAQMIAGDSAAAKASFARALELNPDDKRVRTSAALAKLGAGQGDAAFSELESIAKADTSTTADLALINARLARGQYPQAAKAIDVLAAKVPTQALPDHLRGVVALGARENAAARKHFEAALAKEPNYFPALANLVRLDLAEGKADSARSRLEAARKQDRGNAQILLALASLATQRGAPVAEVVALLDEAVRLRPSDPAPHLALIDHHLASGRRDLAVLVAEKAVSAVPDSQALLDALGMAQRAQGAFEQSIATYNKMVLQFPRSPLGNLRLSESYLEAGNTPLAAERVKVALKDAPRSVAAQRVAAVVALRQGKPAQAFAIARTVQEQSPGGAVGHELEAEIAMALRQFDRAVLAYRKALDKSASPAVAKRLHLALIADKRPAEAARWAQEWLKSHPQDTPFVVHLADVALSQGDLAEAETHYREVAKRLPGNALAINNLAYTLIKQKKPGGLAMAEQAAKLAPNDAVVLDTLAAGYLAEDQPLKAIEWQRKAVDLQPEAGMLRLSLARMYIQTAEREKAVSELDRLATQGRSFSGYSEVAQLRKKLGP